MNEDMTARYNTPLSPQEERAFQQWAVKQKRAGDTYDYDLRGAWKTSAQEATNGHLPDTWKKPNHPTFSSESRYSSAQMPGGKWIEGKGGAWVFQASPYNVRAMTREGLERYFREAEPDAHLVLPAGAPQQWHRQILTK